MSQGLSYETRHRAGDALSTHRHATAYAALTLAGCYLERSADGPVACAPGTMIVHPAFHAHGNRFGHLGARVINIPVSATVNTLTVCQAHHLGEALDVFRNAPALLDELLRAARPHQRHALADWHAPFLEALRAGDEPVGTIATRLGVSAAHASRSIQAAYGMSPQLLRREYRWRSALAMLPTTRSLADIAALAGFADQSHLTRVTRSISGASPAALRRGIKCVQDPATVPPVE
ncbi:AraC family transcriptional regulator [Tahibacter amnicola]|uniref:Helix-turn-helix domain-containing protein n=1 Tax=Tahibacter amnicola TaxID=2976241 RepID=A0ABY6BDN9_9GAMM|nr:helix-turn-helix domain-containing protein [Tahibacter amnicola]UXI67922.1 helix-turn-helix domain-containing protein [Tahibacter amnicola]